MIFIASRLSEGNKLFPAEIHIEENGIKVKIPGFLSGDTRFINYEHITGVDINTPMIGFSSITFYNRGNRAYAHGFKKEEAIKIKEAIDRGQAKAKIKTVEHTHLYTNPIAQAVQQQVVETKPIITQATIQPQTIATKNNGMYSEQLEKLIEFAVSDGEITEKERTVLFKKAEAEGIDLDEFEMVLDAKLYEKNKNKSTVPQQIMPEIPTPKSDKLGDFKKCPSCGATAQAFSTRCTDCGHDFSGIAANSSAKKLFEMLNEIESKRSDTDTSIKAAFGSLLTKSLGGGIGDKINSQKKELISSFPIPNTKDDILEFLSLALPKATKQGNFFTAGSFNSPANERNKLHNEFVPIWQTKCQQIIMKARFSMKEDKKTLDEINSYASQLGIN